MLGSAQEERSFAEVFSQGGSFFSGRLELPYWSAAASASTSESPRSCRMASSLDSGGREATETEDTSARAARVSRSL